MGFVEKFNGADSVILLPAQLDVIPAGRTSFPTVLLVLIPDGNGLAVVEPMALSKASTVTGVSKLMGRDTWANPMDSESVNALSTNFFMVQFFSFVSVTFGLDKI